MDIHLILPYNEDRRRKLTPEEITKIQELKAKGNSDRAIAKVMQVNHTTIRYWTGDKERQNQKTIERTRKNPPDKATIQERRISNRQHMIDVHGIKKVREYYKMHTRIYRSKKKSL